ncbi:hypothetical protein [Streptomyces sp. SP2-10]|uniref:hypothetical protein n=1 Tax=Streptomyces sp. SP2-10 TaxID=2873385 RepID=UPI001CA73D5D|nr:hypothetical protein [Streptomyces sp. SP2-10]MBY8841350.1 hypothetical protein [Streptomyces sp. SP2-10]
MAATTASAADGAVLRGSDAVDDQAEPNRADRGRAEPSRSGVAEPSRSGVAAAVDDEPAPANR